jgi:hypothetical protein
MNPLFAEPTAEQARLLEVIWDTYAASGKWPIYQYVDATLDDAVSPIDAGEAVLSCPIVRSPMSRGGYSWVWVTGNPGYPTDADEIGLSVAGMNRIGKAKPAIDAFISALSALVGVARGFKPSPSKAQVAKVTSTELRSAMFPLRDAEFKRLGGVLSREPAHLGLTVSQLVETDEWTVTINSRMRPFREVKTADEYVERLALLISPPQPKPAPAFVSSLALPEAVDYLNAVWRLRAAEPLIVLARAEAAAKLALECSTADEFETRLSALCTIFAHLRVPEKAGESSLLDLKAHMATQLSAEALSRVDEAIDDLRALFSLRAWRQHAGAHEKGLAAMQRLGIRLPADDWSAAWRELQARTVTALNALREECEA